MTKGFFTSLLFTVAVFLTAGSAKASTFYAFYPGNDITTIQPAFWSNQLDITPNQLDLQWNTMVAGAKSANALVFYGNAGTDNTIANLSTVSSISKIGFIALFCNTPPQKIQVGQIALYQYYIGANQNCQVGNLVITN